MGTQLGPIGTPKEQEENLCHEVVLLQRDVEKELTDAMRVWANSVPEDRLRIAIEQLAEARRSLDRQIAAYEEALRAIAGLRRIGEDGNGHELPSKREAVLQFLEEHPSREFKLGSLRRELVARGWLPDTQKAGHALQMQMMKLLEEGLVERPRLGVYRLAAKRGHEVSAAKEAA